MLKFMHSFQATNTITKQHTSLITHHSHTTLPPPRIAGQCAPTSLPQISQSRGEVHGLSPFRQSLHFPHQILTFITLSFYTTISFDKVVIIHSLYAKGDESTMSLADFHAYRSVGRTPCTFSSCPGQLFSDTDGSLIPTQVIESHHTRKHCLSGSLDNHQQQS